MTEHKPWFEISNGFISAHGLVAVLLTPLFLLMFAVGIALVGLVFGLALLATPFAMIAKLGHNLARRQL